jgi:hypothetical protein
VAEKEVVVVEIEVAVEEIEAEVVIEVIVVIVEVAVVAEEATLEVEGEEMVGFAGIEAAVFVATGAVVSAAIEVEAFEEIEAEVEVVVVGEVIVGRLEVANKASRLSPTPIRKIRRSPRLKMPCFRLQRKGSI